MLNQVLIVLDLNLMPLDKVKGIDYNLFSKPINIGFKNQDFRLYQKSDNCLIDDLKSLICLSLFSFKIWTRFFKKELVLIVRVILLYIYIYNTQLILHYYK